MVVRVRVSPVLLVAVVRVAEAVVVDDEVSEVVAALGNEGSVVGFGHRVVDGIGELDLKGGGLGSAVSGASQGFEALEGLGSGGGFGPLGAGTAGRGRGFRHPIEFLARDLRSRVETGGVGGRVKGQGVLGIWRENAGVGALKLGKGIDVG